MIAKSLLTNANYMLSAAVLAMVYLLMPNIVCAQQVTELQSMRFGIIPNTIGKCRLTFAGKLRGTCSGQGTAALFGVQGSANQFVSLSIPKSVKTYTNLVLKPKLRSTSLLLDNSGYGEFEIRANLLVQGPVEGEFEFSYNVSVNYE